MDKVFIKGLAIQTTIGFFQWEKEIKQTLVIDVDMAWDTAKAAINDELEKTLDYAEISTAIEAFANDNPVDLLETLAERMASYLMSQFHIPWLRLAIGKPGAVHNAITVGVEIERGTLEQTKLHNETTK
ncbi:dihydroneopterin aldolase [Colwellia sp. 4_MG-2023]|jgi:dihydroneopterin aldolase|uniref:dihydroneopterin aldolase n=1 Tax=unclassified Colwellia TaxID=196834 RepID=UPI001C0914BB|nr:MULTISPECIES: dihydroneopterin aldolase [unclassified Colwellia]MBU2926261.1 dihydroneopterin aldolase [Colwellia sp. C2M11]MDO6489428.1 dihydroneopterin aldolase [Colwellia sp. 6_MG-2023]MDO6508508.1 dihydroneopterin aldolase [Colwellia sp. 5_MG-2023]MDO6557123.1 dihydroneopterin aldolase [Colwellia sp. 4_MG-2023]MDO6652317.1 dihydroneopterin aldolase [Colwellia sp. 3_MG-2023]